MKEQKHQHKHKHHPKEQEEKASIMLTSVISVLISTIVYFVSPNKLNSIIALFASFILISLYFFTKKKLEESIRIKKMEDVFPDFIELMASNLRAGMTIDKALLLSSRKEFAPLDEEILLLGKEIITGKEIMQALHDMALRINSEKIKKTIPTSSYQKSR